MAISILLTFLGSVGTFVIRNSFKRELWDFREELRREFVGLHDLEARKQITDERFERIYSRLRDIEQRGNHNG